MDEETGTRGSGASTKCLNLMSGDRSASLLRALKNDPVSLPCGVPVFVAVTWWQGQADFSVGAVSW